MTPTYKEQEKHLHEQYIVGLVKPLDCEFCFCGNLLGERVAYGSTSYPRGYELFWPLRNYSVQQLSAMEDALFSDLNAINFNQSSVNYETALFNGMVAALEVLKQVHRERGEDIDGEQTVFTKRALLVQIQ